MWYKVWFKVYWKFLIFKLKSQLHADNWNKAQEKTDHLENLSNLELTDDGNLAKSKL